jgi:hypothetical protein
MRPACWLRYLAANELFFAVLLEKVYGCEGTRQHVRRVHYRALQTGCWERHFRLLALRGPDNNESMLSLYPDRLLGNPRNRRNKLSSNSS